MYSYGAASEGTLQRAAKARPAAKYRARRTTRRSPMYLHILAGGSACMNLSTLHAPHDILLHLPSYRRVLAVAVKSAGELRQLKSLHTGTCTLPPPSSYIKPRHPAHVHHRLAKVPLPASQIQRQRTSRQCAVAPQASGTEIDSVVRVILHVSFPSIFR